MSLETDSLIDRRRLKRRLGFWRVIAVLALIALIAVGAGRYAGLTGGKHIAILDVNGVIISNPEISAAVRRLVDDTNAEALIVRINSPGGTVAGGEGLFRDIRLVAEVKPVVAVIGELGTSAGYMTALGADHIIAREGSITGSIGVILQSTDITGLLTKLGISAEAIKSSPLKAQPNPLEPLTPEARAATQAVVADIYDMFVGMVAERRNMSRERVAPLADGRIFTGRQALANGLIDGIGNLPEARDWLASVHNIPLDTPARLIERRPEDGLLRDALDDLFGKALFSERLRLDGLISLWHPGVQ